MSQDATQNLEPIRVLLVEDALDQALLVRAMLGSDLYRVVHAQDGMHGLRTFQAQDFDLVITDLNLPGMDGFELTRELKRTHPRTPVLATTGHLDPGYAEAAYRAGVDILLRKPVDRDLLLDEIRKLLPDRHPTPRTPPSVFALAARSGDAVLGCGGTLAFHHAQGHRVVIFVLEAESDGGALDRRRARQAGERLGARVLMGNRAVTPEEREERRWLVKRVVQELDPDVAYIPSVADSDPDRLAAHHLGMEVLRDTGAVLAYGTATATLDFRPGFYKAIDSYVSHKLEALEAFQGSPPPPRELSARFAQASARYWGRFADFREVEPFQVIRGEGRRP